MSLKNYIFSSVNYKGGDSDRFATIRVKPKKPKAKMAKVAEQDVDAQMSKAIEPVATVPPPAAVQNGDAAPKRDTSFLKQVLRFWRYISVEPIILCWLLPSCFLFIAVENLALEKVGQNGLHI